MADLGREGRSRAWPIGAATPRRAAEKGVRLLDWHARDSSCLHRKRSEPGAPCCPRSASCGSPGGQCSRLCSRRGELAGRWRFARRSERRHRLRRDTGPVRSRRALRSAMNRDASRPGPSKGSGANPGGRVKSVGLPGLLSVGCPQSAGGFRTTSMVRMTAHGRCEERPMAGAAPGGEVPPRATSLGRGA